MDQENREKTESVRVKALEEALRRCEAERARAQALTHLGNWKLDVETMTGTGSDEFFRILGISRPEVFTCRDFEALVHPEDRGIVDDTIAEAINERKKVEREYRTILPDGSVRYIQSEGEYAVESGRAILFGTIQDITERVQLEQAVRDSEQSFINAFEASPAPTVICRQGDEQYQAVNKAFEKATGISRSEALGKTTDELHLTAVPGTMPRLLKELAQGGDVYNREILFQGKDKNLIVGLISIIPFVFRRQPCFLFVGVDISDRKKAEDALRRNEYELKSIVDNTTDIYFRLNRRFQYLYVNPAYEKLTGLAKEQFIGRTNDQLGMNRQTAQLWQTAAQEVLESGKERTVEFEMDSFFGKRFFSARLIPEFEKSGLVEAVLVIARDITDSRHAEKETVSLKK